MNENDTYLAIGRHVAEIADEFNDGGTATLLDEAAFQLDDALAEGDFETVQDLVQGVIKAVFTVKGEHALLAHAVAVRLSQLQPAADPHYVSEPHIPVHTWQPVFEDEHGWDEDQDQEVVRAEHERNESVAAIRLYANAINHSYSAAASAAEKGQPSFVTADIATLPGLARLLCEAHERWRAAMATLMARDPDSAGPAVALHAEVLDQWLRERRAADGPRRREGR